MKLHSTLLITIAKPETFSPTYLLQEILPISRKRKLESPLRRGAFLASIRQVRKQLGNIARNMNTKKILIYNKKKTFSYT